MRRSGGRSHRYLVVVCRHGVQHGTGDLCKGCGGSNDAVDRLQRAAALDADIDPDVVAPRSFDPADAGCIKFGARNFQHRQRSGFQHSHFQASPAHNSSTGKGYGGNRETRKRTLCHKVEIHFGQVVFVRDVLATSRGCPAAPSSYRADIAKVVALTLPTSRGARRLSAHFSYRAQVRFAASRRSPRACAGCARSRSALSRLLASPSAISRGAA